MEKRNHTERRAHYRGEVDFCNEILDYLRDPYRCDLTYTCAEVADKIEALFNCEDPNAD